MKAPLHVVLYQPEIPPNTGNIARLCAGFVCKGEITFPSPGRLSPPDIPLVNDGIRPHRAGA